MIYPKGEAVYENMNTSFTNFGELLSDLRSNNFTGSVHVSFWEYEGNIFLDNGNIMNAVEEIEGSKVTGREAVERISEKAKEKGGSISVYALSEEMVTLLGSVVQSELIYQDLSTDFTSVDGLINKLRRESHTGFVEVDIENDPKDGYIYFLSGEIIDCYMAKNGDELTGIKILSRIVDAAARQGANFNVYQAAIEDSFAEEEEIRVSHQFPEMLETWGLILGTVESVVSEAVGEKQFLNILKETMIDHANDYPFLDPFAARFRYEEGEIDFRGEPEKRLSQGVGVCLEDTIDRLDAENPGQDLKVRIYQRLGQVSEEQANRINKLGLTPHIPGQT